MASIEISIVIPAYNEEDNIVACAANAIDAAKKYFNTFEVIVVDDGSRDATHQRAAEFADKHTELHVFRKPNGGIGSALAFGFAKAKGVLLTYGPGDGQFDFNQLPKLLEKIDGYDLVVGSKQELIGYSAKRKLTSAGMRVLLLILFGLRFRDVNYIHLMRSEAYQKLNLTSHGGFFHAETIIKAKYAGLKMSEAMLALKPREAGAATAWSIKNIVTTLAELVGLRLKLWFSR